LSNHERDDAELRDQIWSLIELIVHRGLDSEQLAQLKTHDELRSLAERAELDQSGTKAQLAERVFAELSEAAETMQKWSLQLNMIADGRLSAESLAQLNSSDDIRNFSYYLGYEPLDTKEETAQAIFDFVRENFTTDGDPVHDPTEEDEGGNVLGGVLAGVAAVGLGMMAAYSAEQQAAAQREQEGVDAFVDGFLAVLGSGLDEF
jgi:hypothetical protein